MSSNNALFQGLDSSTSTLRPRNARLISYLDEDSPSVDTAPKTTSTSSSTNTSRLPTMTSSPSAPAGRTTSIGSKGASSSKHTTHHRSTSEDVNQRVTHGLWNPWSSIQGITSTFLGGEVLASSATKGGGGKKTPAWMKQDKTYGPLKTAESWGPKIDEPTIGLQNAVEERQGLVQAKRREALLVSAAQENKDVLGRYKRKGSDANFAAARGALSDEDALVYRHKIRPGDTLPGVIIKYSCQPEVFRKVNRFWPNDNIQTRRTVLLPVEACAIRGRKVESPAAPDLLGAELANTQLKSKPNESPEDASYDLFPDTENAPPEPSKPSSFDSEEDDYKHDSWIILPSFTQPTEILRIPKRILGYFPPARRKSNTPFSDISAESTPKTSFDTLRHPPTHAAQQAQLQHQNSLSLDASPVRRPVLPTHLSSHPRHRSSSTVSAPNTDSNAFMTALRGPGGVGTLRGLRTELARPGPAEDPLNKKFAQYIPDLLPPEEDFLSSSFDKSRSFSSSVRVTPRVSIDSVRSSRSNSSAVPATIEGWMKKITGAGTPSGSNVAVSPARRRAGLNRVNSNNIFGAAAVGDAVLRAEMMGGGGMGDLIELEVNPDSLADGGHPQHASASTRDDTEQEETTPRATPVLGTTSRKDRNLDNTLDEHFPVRGRVTRAYGDD